MAKPLEAADAIYLATRGGAALLDMEDTLGSLEAGKLADFIVVDMNGKNSGDRDIVICICM